MAIFLIHVETIQWVLLHRTVILNSHFMASQKLFFYILKRQNQVKRSGDGGGMSLWDWNVNRITFHIKGHAQRENSDSINMQKVRTERPPVPMQ